MDSPMPKIIANRPVVPEFYDDVPIRKVREASDKLFDETIIKITPMFQKLLQDEFNRVKKRHPALQKVFFGMGTFLISFETGSRYHDGVYNTSPERLPQYMQRLVYVCDWVNSDWNWCAIEDVESVEKEEK